MKTFNLQRFIEAQDQVYEIALEELRAGDKRSHWMWYIFPQIKGLGRSFMSQKFAIESLEEAKSYLAHTILGYRLVECTQIVLDLKSRTAEQIFSYPDDLKFRSCMTLFEQAADDQEVFRLALLKYFEGQPDAQTLEILRARPKGS